MRILERDFSQSEVNKHLQTFNIQLLSDYDSNNPLYITLEQQDKTFNNTTEYIKAQLIGKTTDIFTFYYTNDS